MEVGLGPGDLLLDGGPSFPPKWHSSIFGPCLLWLNGWMDQDASWYGLGHVVLDGDPTPPPKKRGTGPQFSARLLWPNGRPSQLLLSTCLHVQITYPSVLSICTTMSLESTSFMSNKKLWSRRSLTLPTVRHWIASNVLMCRQETAHSL